MPSSPVARRNALNSWIYYFPNTQSPGHYSTNPRYFSNLTTGVIFTM